MIIRHGCQVNYVISCLEELQIQLVQKKQVAHTRLYKYGLDTWKVNMLTNAVDWISTDKC